MTRKILMLGMSPMPFENDIKVYGTGIRTWQFAQPLLDKGHRLCLVCYAVPSAYPDGFVSTSFKDYKYGNYSFEYHILKKDDFEDKDLLLKIAGEFNPDCMVGCTFYPSFIGTKLKNAPGDKAVPLWADLFGHVMAEAQARSCIDKNDRHLFHYWNSEYNIITGADIFSCVSARQEYATIGELGAVGRLNTFTCGYEFTRTIPCGLPSEKYEHKKRVIRGENGIEKDDFVILWTGGYNTWTDVDTLFKGLSLAMDSNPKIKFVSTGGEIPEQDMKTYPHFLSMIESSPYKNRFVMKGWIPGSEVPDHYLEADAGINIDRDIYEVRLGSKNRILDWFRAGLCVLTSNVCELAELMAGAGAGYVFEPGNPGDLADKLIMLASDPEKARTAGKKGMEFGFSQFNFKKTTLPLQQWVEDPKMAPDRGKESELFMGRERALANLDRISRNQEKMIEERDKRIRELEGLVKRGLPYRIYSYFKVAGRKARAGFKKSGEKAGHGHHTKDS
ncbi:MAG: glycosyltransferase family 4 protein [Actinobacteria bacterium]|nr:glycosyltransferase family 4 protein [Actinomycetota bacterium]